MLLTIPIQWLYAKGDSLAGDYTQFYTLPISLNIALACADSENGGATDDYVEFVFLYTDRVEVRHRSRGSKDVIVLGC